MAEQKYDPDEYKGKPTAKEITDKIATEENKQDREAMMAPLRKAKDYVVDKYKSMTSDTPPTATKKMAKGGKVAGQLATRGYGMCKGGKTK